MLGRPALGGVGPGFRPRLQTQVSDAGGLAWRMGVAAAGHLLQGNFKHRRAVAGEGPAADPATVVAVIDTDDLVHVFVAVEGDAITLMERHDFQ